MEVAQPKKRFRAFIYTRRKGGCASDSQAVAPDNLQISCEISEVNAPQDGISGQTVWKEKDSIKYGAQLCSIENIQVQRRLSIAREGLYHATFVCGLDKVFMQSHEGGELPLPFPAQTPFGSDSVWSVCDALAIGYDLESYLFIFFLPSSGLSYLMENLIFLIQWGRCL